MFLGPHKLIINKPDHVKVAKHETILNPPIIFEDIEKKNKTTSPILSDPPSKSNKQHKNDRKIYRWKSKVHLNKEL